MEISKEWTDEERKNLIYKLAREIQAFSRRGGVNPLGISKKAETITFLITMDSHDLELNREGLSKT